MRKFKAMQNNLLKILFICFTFSACDRNHSSSKSNDLPPPNVEPIAITDFKKPTNKQQGTSSNSKDNKLELLLDKIKANSGTEGMDMSIVNFLASAKDVPLATRFQIAQRVNSIQLRKELISELSLEYAAVNPRELFDFSIKELTGIDRNVAQTYAVRGLISWKEYSAAADLIQKANLSDSRLQDIYNLSSVWAASDPDRALQWVVSLPSKEDREKALAGTVSSLVKAYKLDAINKISKITSSQNIISGVINESLPIALKDTGIAGSIKWIASLPTSSQDFAISRLIDLSPVELSSEWEKLNSLAKTNSQKLTIVSSIASKLTVSNPNEAVQWAGQLPPSMRSTAYGTIAHHWYEQDSDGLSNWIESMPKGTDRDTVLSTVALNIVHKDRSTAKELIGQISDPRTRQKMTEALK